MYDFVMMGRLLYQSSIIFHAWWRGNKFWLHTSLLETRMTSTYWNTDVISQLLTGPPRNTSAADYINLRDPWAAVSINSNADPLLALPWSSPSHLLPDLQLACRLRCNPTRWASSSKSRVFEVGRRACWYQHWKRPKLSCRCWSMQLRETEFWLSRLSGLPTGMVTITNHLKDFCMVHLLNSLSLLLTRVAFLSLFLLCVKCECEDVDSSNNEQ